MARPDPTLLLCGQLELPLQMPPPADARLRRILLGARLVEYQLVHGRRRGLGMRIDHRGLRVGAPPRTPLVEVERFLGEHAGWIVEKLDAWGAALDTRHVVVASGLRIPVLGVPGTLTLADGPWQARWCGADLALAVPPRLGPAAALRMALEERAIELFRERAGVLGAALGVALPRITLSDAEGRWGSCSRRSGVRLNWRLVHLPLPLVDYVVAHELAHLVEMNHSPRFWAVVARVCPDHRARRRELAQLARDLPRF